MGEMGDASHISGKLDDSSVVQLTGKIMVAAIICLFLVVIIVFCFHLYAKWFWYRRSDSNGNTTRRRRRFDFAAGYQEATAAAAALRRGLDPSVLKTIPIVEVSPKDFKDGLECAVCLCEVSEGEKARLLPKCNHGFHVECIDMWFQSHSTCPLCRNPIPNSTTPTESSEDTSSVSSETPNFPTNVLFWGDETRVSTLGSGLEEPPQGPISAQSSCPPSSSSSSSSASNVPEGILVIDIPRQIIGEDDQELKSPMTTRLRSLKRLLSREKRVSPRSPCSNLDVEQGVRSQS